MTGEEKTYMTREDEEKLSSIKLYAINNQILDWLLNEENKWSNTWPDRIGWDRNQTRLI